MNTRKTGVIIIIASLVAIIIAGASMFMSLNSLSSLEAAKLLEVSNDISPTLEEIEDCDRGADCYTMYAIEYLYAKDGTTDFKLDDIKNVLSARFAKEFKDEELITLGGSMYATDRGITTGAGDVLYHLDRSKVTQAYIASKPIVKYVEKESKKQFNKMDDMVKNSIGQEQFNKYVVIYDKLVVKDPYKVLNYYVDTAVTPSNLGVISEKIKAEKTDYDTSGIYAYLTGGGKVGPVKEAINEKNIDEIGERAGEVKVTYVVHGDKLLVENIEKQ